MNYDRIILELLNRVSALESDVEALKSRHVGGAPRSSLAINPDNSDESCSCKDEKMCYTSDHVNSKEIYMSRPSIRDTTRYLLDGRTYGKNRLVLATVKKYAQAHPRITAEELMQTFDRSLQGSLGVVRKLDEVQNSYADCARRFFTQDGETINTATGVCVVCTQWAAFNINRFVQRAGQLGMKIEPVP